MRIKNRSFNPLAPCGARHSRLDGGIFAVQTFNPLAPCGARPRFAAKPALPRAFQSTRPLRGETGEPAGRSGEADGFQSTRPLRGETSQPEQQMTPSCFQSTRPLRGETFQKNTYGDYSGLSIHSPLAGRDHPTLQSWPRRLIFQSTRPLRGETIRAPSTVACYRPFNPLAPCGARLTRVARDSSVGGFQSTRPLRGETRNALYGEIHVRTFNPLAPCGARRRFNSQALNALTFNPLAPCGARRRPRRASILF